MSDLGAVPTAPQGGSRGSGGDGMGTIYEALWTALQVARYLGCSRSWVYLHAEDGTLPSVRIGGLRRFVPAEIRAFALAGSKRRRS